MNEKKPSCTSESGGSEYITYVDYFVDELDLADLVKLILECKGYDVVTKTSSVEALEEFKSNPQKFDLLVTNISKPAIQGRRHTAEIMKIRPHFPAVSYTGNRDLVSPEKEIKMGLWTLFQKPFSLGILVSTIRKVLDNMQVRRRRP